MSVNTEPVAIGAAVTILANAVLVMLTALNVWTLTETQQASVMGVVTAIVVLATSVWARSRVTPVTPAKIAPDVPPQNPVIDPDVPPQNPEHAA